MPEAKERTFMDIAREADRVLKNLRKADQSLSALDKQISSLQEKRNKASFEAGELDADLKDLKKEMEALI